MKEFCLEKKREREKLIECGSKSGLKKNIPYERTNDDEKETDLHAED